MARFTDRISRDSASAPGEGPDAHRRWPVEPGRYRLVVSPDCPRCERAVIVRRRLGLEDAISLAVADPLDLGFSLDPGHRDPVLGIRYLAEAYRGTDPGYEGPVTVPAIVDTRTGLVVTNDFPQLVEDLATEWSEPGLGS